MGLTATPAKHTFGFFNQNLVMEYRAKKAVTDGVTVHRAYWLSIARATSRPSGLQAKGYWSGP